MAPSASMAGMAAPYDSPSAPQELPTDSPTPRATRGRQPTPLYGCGVRRRALQRLGRANEAGGPLGAVAGWGPKGGAALEKPRTRMREALALAGAGIDRIAFIPYGLRNVDHVALSVLGELGCVRQGVDPLHQHVAGIDVLPQLPPASSATGSESGVPPGEGTDLPSGVGLLPT